MFDFIIISIPVLLLMAVIGRSIYAGKKRTRLLQEQRAHQIEVARLQSCSCVKAK